MKRVILLGATGSIGRSTLEVIRAHPDRFRLVAISAHSRSRELEAIATAFDVERHVATGGADGAGALDRMIRRTEAEIVVNGIAGAAGLAPSVAALESGKELALANKETIVMAGKLIRALADEHRRTIIPVDSEHSALFQLLHRIGRERVRRLVLTASGGAFRDLPTAELAGVTVERALAHPTWKMGPKITIDSATMANKGLEIIEAVELFDFPVDVVDVVIHRQSAVHALVRSTDGSLYAQMSNPDMRIPIQHALSHPEELPSPVPDLALEGLTLDFAAPDPARYPALALARSAASEGGEYAIAYNAANEVAVAAFLAGRIAFPAIADTIDACLAAGWGKLVTSFAQVYRSDERAREMARTAISRDGMSPAATR